MALQCLLYICYFVSIFIYLRNIVHMCNAMWSVLNCVVFRVFARLQLWKSGRLMNTVNCNSIPLGFYKIGYIGFVKNKKKFIDLYLKTCFLHSSPDAFPKGRVSIPELLPLQLSALTLQAAQQQKISPRFSFPCTISRR